MVESAGKYLLLISLGLLFLYACSIDDTGQSSKDLLAETTSNCGYTLPAAAYHLMNPDSLFRTPSLWVGQPAHYFVQRMSENSYEFEQFRIRFETSWGTLSKNEQSELAKQLTRWCNTYFILNSKEESYSIEELLYRLSELDEFKPIFRNILGDEFYRLASTNSINRFAALSSAQIYSLHQSIITSLSQLEEESYRHKFNLICLRL